MGKYKIKLMKSGKDRTLSYDRTAKRTIKEHVRLIKLAGCQVILVNEHKQKFLVPFQNILHLEEMGYTDKYDFNELYGLIMIMRNENNNV